MKMPSRAIPVPPGGHLTSPSTLQNGAIVLPMLSFFLFLFVVILCLGSPHIIIQAILIFHQFVMTSVLHNFTAVKYDNIVTEAAGGQPV